MNKNTARAGGALPAPLFIIGTGRCGSTVFHDLLAFHPGVTWLSPLINRYPTRPQLNSALMNLVNVPVIGDVMRRKWFPIEAYRFWDRHYCGFSMPCRDLTAEDAFPGAIASMRAAARSCTRPSHPRLLCKITGWPRIGFLHAIYPDAKFINVIRDGRAVASSLLKVHFWLGWRGPEHWGWGPLTAEQSERWEESHRSFVVLAGLQWEILMRAYQDAKRTIPADRILEIRYERLCADPLGALRTATDFAQLEFAPQLAGGLEHFQLRSQNGKWKEGLTSSQQAILRDCIGGPLSQWGY